jgi:protoporphyrinogen oxidase
MKEQEKKIILIGAGPLGLSCAHYILRSYSEKIKIIMIDAGESIGGAAQTHMFDGYLIDRYYHFYSWNDHYDAKSFLDSLKVPYNIVWKKINTATFSNGGHHNFDSILATLKLAKKDFFKVVVTLLNLRFFMPDQRLDKVTAIEWSRSSFGKEFSQKIWEPLLRDKFGSDAKDISAFWLAMRIKQHLSSKVGLKSKIGYLEKTYQPYFESIIDRIQKSGGNVYLKNKVQKINFANDHILEVELGSGGKLQLTKNDVVISTIPLVGLNELLKDDPRFSYLNVFKASGVILLTLSLDAKLSDEYWTTVCDQEIPFQVVVQQNRLYPRGEKEIVYLSRYHLASDGAPYETDDEIKEAFIEGLIKMYPHFSATHIRDMEISRLKVACPVPHINTLCLLPSLISPVRHFYHVGFEHLYPKDRGVGNAFYLGKKLADLIKAMPIDPRV